MKSENVFLGTRDVLLTLFYIFVTNSAKFNFNLIIFCSAKYLPNVIDEISEKNCILRIPPHYDVGT